jgi:FAD:protein FMN transferase
MTGKGSPGERRPAVQQNPEVQTDSTVLASSTVLTNSTMLVHVLDVMNIPFTIMVKPWEQSEYEFRRNRGITAEKTRLAVSEIECFLHEVDRRFSPFKPDSLVSQARRGDWSALLDDGDFQEIYAKSALAKTLTHGAFDAFHQGTYDPTGLVKGWAIDKATTRFLSPS